MERYGRHSDGPQPDPSQEWTAPGTETGLEEPMWQLGLGGGGGGTESYPERPDEADCIYYLRTGFCGYGARCRFNHPRDRAAVIGAARAGGGEYPERVGQPVCQYYMRTGTCKFGASCKYHHPRQGGESVTPVSLNYFGLPLRPGEKECSYYVKTGQSPQVAAVPTPVHAPTLYQSGMVPFTGWSHYPPPPMSPVPSPSTQSAVGSGQFYGITQLSPTATAYTYLPLPSSVGPSSSSQKEHPFPERPGQQDCPYYMRTGDCKFGSSCRYHHPTEFIAPKTNVALSPLGLPLRPGAPPCTHYAQRGVCKFGPVCKFDHPVGTLSYSPSASSLTDVPVAPYPVGSSIGTLAPSSSSSELRPELISGSSKDSVSSRMSSSMSTSSGSIGSTFSQGGPTPHSTVQQSAPGSGPSTGSSNGSTEPRTSN
ncbi:hypothetical protein CMV_014723 [Castanea mollissima]|uniref:C3H1-type domain-containing protein n=1 Tax=Castanea mollissima TaxID=60419 RepID=A0A8J4VGS5_9ROSI|nr:hypothetical protein CMV_014723 [Castanea mollissima]